MRYFENFCSLNWRLFFPKSIYLSPCPCTNLSYQPRQKTKNKKKKNRRNLPKVEPLQNNHLPHNRHHCFKTSGTGFAAIYFFTSLELSLDNFSWNGGKPKFITVYLYEIPNTIKMNSWTFSLEIRLNWKKNPARWPTHLKEDITFFNLSSVVYLFPLYLLSSLSISFVFFSYLSSVVYIFPLYLLSSLSISFVFFSYLSSVVYIFPLYLLSSLSISFVFISYLLSILNKQHSLKQARKKKKKTTKKKRRRAFTYILFVFLYFIFGNLFFVSWSSISFFTVGSSSVVFFCSFSFVFSFFSLFCFYRSCCLFVFPLSALLSLFLLSCCFMFFFDAVTSTMYNWINTKSSQHIKSNAIPCNSYKH